MHQILASVMLTIAQAPQQTCTISQLCAPCWASAVTHWPKGYRTSDHTHASSVCTHKAHNPVSSLTLDDMAEATMLLFLEQVMRELKPQGASQGRTVEFVSLSWESACTRVVGCVSRCLWCGQSPCWTRCHTVLITVGCA